MRRVDSDLVKKKQGCNISSAVLAGAVLIVFAMELAPVTSYAQMNLFGVVPGMQAPAVLKVLKKDSRALKNLKFISGKQILSDTVPATFCNLMMRRSLGFDSAGVLRVIGLTYKTNHDSVPSAHDCAMQWLANTFGSPVKQETTTEQTEETWLPGKDKLMLETKKYNEHDAFLMIYYYAASEK